MHRILVDMHRLRHNAFNGLYNYSVGLGKALIKLQDKDIDWYYYLPADKFGFFGNEVQYVKQRSIDKLYRFGTSRFDLWHVTTTLSWYHPFNSKTKNVFTLHDLNFLIEEKENHERNKRLLKQVQQRVNRADHIVAISKFALKQGREFLSLEGKPTTVIYNGLQISDEAVNEKPPYQPAGKFLFTVGLVQPRKNFHVLPALLKGNDLELIVAGLHDHPYARQVMAAAGEHGVANRVKLVGPVTELQKNWYYKNCEAFLFPSFAEGFGLPVIEAMHFGKPVFISTATSLPEVGGDLAYYFNSFEPADMRTVFENGMHHFESKNPAEQIRRHAARFNWEDAAAQYVEVYKSLL